MELVGEGTGFGLPVVRYRDDEYFSRSSSLHVIGRGGRVTAIKQFVFDMIPRKRFREVKLENRTARKFFSKIDELYQKHRHWRLLMLMNLSKSIGVQTTFERVEPVGSVAVIYDICSSHVHVKADFKSLRKHDLQKIFLLNEQSSRFFGRYCDSNGSVLIDKEVGAWEKIEAEWGLFSDKSNEVGFRLWKVRDAVFYRGRELLEDTLDWVGLDYEVAPENPHLEYDIEIIGRRNQK